MHSRTENMQFYNQVLALNSKQTAELLENRKGISSAQCCLIRLQSFKGRWKNKEQKPPSGFKNAMKTHREPFKLLLSTKVKGKQMQL